MSARTLLAVALLVTATDALATLVADYQGSLSSSVAGAPDLTLVGAPILAQEQVLYYLPPQNVYQFPAGSGFALSGVSQIVADGATYTIALQARIDGPSADGYAKLIDFDNGAADVGLYDYLSHLEFYSYSGGPALVFGSGYADIVLTRDASAALRGYYNGVLQFTVDDSGNQWGRVYAPPDVLRFFLDDSIGTHNEYSAGAVARIRIWDGALSGAEVLQLTDAIFHDGVDQ